MVREGTTGNPQVPHVDFPCSYNADELLRVAIVALEKFSLYVYPYSHTLMRSMMALHGPNFTTGSTVEIDVEIAQSMSMQIPLRLDVEPGEIIIFDGYLVHAGTEGMSGASRLRLHLYLQSLQNKVTVMSSCGKYVSSFPMQRLHANMVSSEFASKFARVV
jgi:ectoine hydroxylase-related dioxygenase (phytanoyl-CoA dioxygenase family)